MTYAVCEDAYADTCRPVSEPQRGFSSRVGGLGATPETLIWFETEYSRFPGSDVNEVTGFLPVSLLSGEGWRKQVSDMIEGHQPVVGYSKALWFRRNGEDRPGLAFDLYQFNPRGLVKRWKIACQPGDL